MEEKLYLYRWTEWHLHQIHWILLKTEADDCYCVPTQINKEFGEHQEQKKLDLSKLPRLKYKKSAGEVDIKDVKSDWAERFLYIKLQQHLANDDAFRLQFLLKNIVENPTST